MNGRELAEALHSGKRVFGTAVYSTSPRWPAALKAVGADFVFIDTEHTPIQREQLSWMCQAYRALEIAPLVRIPCPDPHQARSVIDAGAVGIIVPYVETAEQAKDLRGAVKLRPLKGKRLQDVLDGRVRLEVQTGDYLTEMNEGHLAIVNIESVAALEALDQILSVPQIDAVLIGPHDLSISLGIPEQYGHRNFEEAVRSIIRKARAKNVGVGVHFSEGVEQEIAWAKVGANFIVHSSDLRTFTNSMSGDMSRMKRVLGDLGGHGQFRSPAGQGDDPGTPAR